MVRLDIAGSDFPSSWPPPEAGTLTVDIGSSVLVLPVVDVSENDQLRFPPGDEIAHHPGHVTWEVRDDVVARIRRVVIDHGGVRGSTESDGASIRDTYGGEVGVRWDEPGHAWAEGGVTFELGWPEVTVTTASHGRLETDAATWRLTLEVKVSENGEVIRERHWERTIPRDLQ
jgi:hypothetical protein